MPPFTLIIADSSVPQVVRARAGYLSGYQNTVVILRFSKTLRSGSKTMRKIGTYAGGRENF